MYKLRCATFLLTFFLFSWILLFSQSNSDKSLYPFTTIGPNLYKIEVDVNSIIASIGSDGVLLCDVGGESKGPGVRETVRKLGGEKIDYIIDTHWHVDHTGGNIYFGKEALIIAHENVRKRLSEDKYLKFWDEEHPAFPEYALPDMVFSDRMTLHFNGEDIEIFHLPGGHTDGDAIVYFRKSNILHIGDCLFSNGFPAIDFEMGGSVEGFADNLRRIASIVPSDVRIIAGHGPDYTVEQLKSYERMIDSSLRIVRDAKQQDMPLEAMQQAHLLKEWEDYSYGFFSCDEWINMIYQSLLHRSNLSLMTSKNRPELKGPYLGQKSPDKTPEIFAPGIVSTGDHEGCAFFSPAGTELYYHKGAAGRIAIVVMKQKNGRWSSPQVAPFSGKYNDAEPHLSYDGQRLVFSSNRPLNGQGEPLETINIWIVERTKTGWGEPRPFGFDVNTEGKELHPTFSRSDDLYFCSNREDELDIYFSQYADGNYLKPQKLSDTINSPFGDGDAYLAPDESYMVFCSYGRPECYGNADLYISFRKEDGSWTLAKNMGPAINTEYREVDPVVSFDGKYLFFRSNRKIHNSYSDIPITYDDIIQMTNNPGNGNGDIYWVDAKIIETLKTK